MQDQEEALKELETRMEEVQREREEEAELKEELTKELKHLREEEKRSTTEKEVRRKAGPERGGEGQDAFCQLSDEKLRLVEVKMEAERSAHLETRFTCQLLQVSATPPQEERRANLSLLLLLCQLQVQDLQAVLERSSQQEALLRAELRKAERASSLEREKKGATEQDLER